MDLATEQEYCSEFGCERELPLMRRLAAKGNSRPFAGGVIRNPVTKTVERIAWLPPYVVPMYADFNPWSSADFIDQLEVAREYHSMPDVVRIGEPTTKKKRFIIVPICSPGGIIENLLEMLQALDDYLFSMDVEMIAIAAGTVASCAFVLFSRAHRRFCMDQGYLLCHQASLRTEGVESVTPDVAGRTARSLGSTTKELYTLAEIGILVAYKVHKQHQETLDAQEKARQQQQTGAVVPVAPGQVIPGTTAWHDASRAMFKLLHDNTEAMLREMRVEWYETHKDTVYAMQKSELGDSYVGVQGRFTADTNILDYITNPEKHDLMIKPMWAKKLNLIDGSIAGLRCRTIDTFVLTTNTMSDIVATINAADVEACMRSLRIEQVGAAGEATIVGHP